MTQRRVPRGMPEGVVDGLEMIHVDDCQRQRLRLRLRRL